MAKWPYRHQITQKFPYTSGALYEIKRFSWWLLNIPDKTRARVIRKLGLVAACPTYYFLLQTFWNKSWNLYCREVLIDNHSTMTPKFLSEYQISVQLRHTSIKWIRRSLARADPSNYHKAASCSVLIRAVLVSELVACCQCALCKQVL